jgi:hypothetical protein
VTRPDRVLAAHPMTTLGLMVGLALAIAERAI